MTRDREEVDELAQRITLNLLAEWIAIEHDKTRLQAHEYIEEAQDLADWLYTIGYRHIGEKLAKIKEEDKEK